MVKYLLRVQVARVRFPPKPPFLKEGYDGMSVSKETVDIKLRVSEYMCRVVIVSSL